MADLDIIVRSKRTGRTVLAVEVKLGGKLEAAYEQLRRYMAMVGCSTGLVVVGRRLGILQEKLGPGPGGTFEVAGEFDTSAIPSLAPPGGTGAQVGFEFERRVHEWLESLTDSRTLEAVPEDLGAALREYVVPWIEVGDIQATGPRPRTAPAA